MKLQFFSYAYLATAVACLLLFLTLRYSETPPPVSPATVLLWATMGWGLAFLESLEH